MRRLIRRRSGDDSGAVATIVAVLLSGGLLMGLGALVIDVGLLAAEREQLQSGADSASWAVAQDCIARPAACTSVAQSVTAANAAGANANDRFADARVCPDALCTPALDPAYGCAPLPNPPGRYVEIRTTTRNADSTTLVPPRFAAALGAGDHRGIQVSACARVAWGPYPNGAAHDVFPLGISACDYQQMTADDSFFAVSSVLDAPGVAPVRGLPAVTPEYISELGPVSPTAFQCPGNVTGYAWLGSPVAPCTARVTPPQARATGPGCPAKLAEARAAGAALLVPIFDAQLPLLAYRVVGFAAFAVTDYTALSVSGYFTRTIEPVGRPGFGSPTPDFGAYVLGRTG